MIAQTLTGGAAFIGAPAKDGMLLAIDDINASGALGAGNTIKATVADDAGDRNQALALLSRYAEDPKIIMFMGPTTGTISPAAAKAANDMKFPIMTVSNATEARTAGPWAFTTAQPGQVALPYVARYAVENQKVKACSIVSITDNEAYVIQAKVFTDWVREHGVKIVGDEKIKQSDTDFSALSVKLANSQQDCLFLSAPASQAANMLIQFRQAGLDPKTRVFGHSGFATPDLMRIGGAAVENVFFNADWVPGGSSPAGKEFVEKFTKRYGREPENFAPVGYSAMLVVASAIKNAGASPTRESFKDAMLKTDKVPVIIGDLAFSYDKDRVPLYGAVVLTVKDGKFAQAK